MDPVMQHLLEVSLQQSQLSQIMACKLHATTQELLTLWHMALLSLTLHRTPSASSPISQWTTSSRRIWPHSRESPPERAGLSESGQMCWHHSSLGEVQWGYYALSEGGHLTATSSRVKFWPAVGYLLLKPPQNSTTGPTSGSPRDRWMHFYASPRGGSRPTYYHQLKSLLYPPSTWLEGKGPVPRPLTRVTSVPGIP